MPKEKSIAKRLSGTEALESLLVEINRRLEKHGHFHSFKAYQGYLAKVTIEFKPAMSFAPPLTDDFEINKLDPGVEADGEPMSVVIELPMRPPNQVREAAGMDLPVQVEENGQIVEKWVKPSKFKGKTKPGTAAPSRSNMSIPTAPGKVAADELLEAGVQPRP